MTGVASPPELRRLLAAMPVPADLPRPPPAAVLAAVEEAGLVGRGGGGFPTARKLAAVAGGRRRSVLVANGAEGEPLSQKDALLLTVAPGLVLDGIALAAHAVGATVAYLCLHRGSPALPAVRAALAARSGGVEVRLRETPDRYVASEESALVRLLSGGRALPTSRPPLPAERGVRRAPTLVLNVETLAGIALAVRGGAEAYRTVGDPAEPGTLLVTVAGAVPAPGVVELPTGTPVGFALEAAGATRESVGAVLTGGYGGAWLGRDAAWWAPLTYAGLRSVGGVLGPGLLAVLPPGGSACGLAETARIARYLAGESAGQCGPCVFGLPAIAGALEAVVQAGPDAAEAAAAVRRWTASVAGRGACRHPDGAARLVDSALRAFVDDVAGHVHGRPCGSLLRVLPVPEPSTEDRS